MHAKFVLRRDTVTEKYDVFISFKNTDKAGRTSRDAVMAESLYRALKRKGIAAFFSKYSIDESARADYVDAIDNALENAMVFVAVGTSRENLSSGWVKHEINQFRALMNAEEQKKRSIVSYRSVDFSPNDLPVGLRSYQSHDDLQSVVRFVDACLKKASGFRNDGNDTVLIYEQDHPTVPSSYVPQGSSHQGLQIGSLLDGRYQILRLIGKGGMSDVYLATDQRLHNTCAVKEIRYGSVKDIMLVLESIRNEARLMQQLDHPAIPKIYDIIESSDSFILIMEYVEGSPLSKILSERGPFEETQVLDFARQLGQVLNHMHERPRPIIYRDLKPANIMLRSDGKLKLIDFGTAREYNPGAIGDTTCLGTVGFAAPEQFGGMGQTDVRTDIYNLGATLYYLVTGRNPAEPPYEICPIRQVNPKLSRGLEFIIQKCIEKDPNNRFQSAAQLLDALENISKLGKHTSFPSIFKGISRSKSSDQPKEKKQPPIPKRSNASPPFAIPGYPQPSHPTTGSFTPVEPIPVVRPPVAPPYFIPNPPFPTAEGAAPVQYPHKGPTDVLNPDPAQTGTLQPEGFPAAKTAPDPQVSQKVSPVIPPEKTPTEQVTSPPEEPKSKSRKVTVRPKASAKGEMDDILAKFMSLDPKSQQLVRDLIDQLSR